MKTQPNKEEMVCEIRNLICRDDAAQLEELIKSGYDLTQKIGLFGETPLVYAATTGAAECLKLLLTIPGIKINKREKRYIPPFDGCTPLYFAALEGHTECIKVLLAQKGINVNKRSSMGDTPLHIAAAYGHTACVQLLLNDPRVKVNRKGSKLIYKSPNSTRRKYIRTTALEDAIRTENTECVKKLLAHPGISTKHIPATILAIAQNDTVKLQQLITEGADVNKKDREGKTALHQAVWYNNPACVELLLQAPGIKPNLKDIYGYTPIEKAVALGYKECLQHLLNAAHVEYDASLLYFAARYKRNECVEMLRNNERIAPSYSPATLAVCQNDVATLRNLIDEGADINASIDDDEATLLHSAVWTDESHDCLQLLLSEAKINPNSINQYGQTPLHIAAHRNEEEYITSLLAHPATDINKGQKQGYTPLDYCKAGSRALAVLKEHGAKARKWYYPFTRPRVVSCIWLGAALSLTGTCHYFGKYDALSEAMVYAAQKGDIDTVEYLVYAGADMDYAQEALWAALNYSPECFPSLLTAVETDPNTPDSNGRTLLHSAALGKTECVKALLATPNINVNLTDNNGETPLQCAAGSGKNDCVDLLRKAPGLDSSLLTPLEWAVINDDADSIRQSVQTCAKPDYHTPLLYAVALNRIPCLQALLSAPGIDINAKLDWRDTALDLAIKHGHIECVKLLLAHKDVRVGIVPLHGENTECVLLACAHPTAKINKKEWLAIRANDCNELKNSLETRDWSKKITEGKSIFFFAGQYGSEECIQVLLDSPLYDALPNESSIILYAAAMTGRKELVQRLLTNPKIEVNTLNASWMYRGYSNSEGVRLILQSPRFDIKKCSPEMIKFLIANRDKENLKLLLSMPGVDCTGTLYRGKTILQNLVNSFDDADLVKQVLSIPGVDVNAKDDYGRTALHYAARSNHRKAVKALLEAPGIDVNSKSDNGSTPLDLTQKRDVIVRGLLRRAGGTESK